MSKSNATAASMAHAPEALVNKDQAHAHKYPGTKTGSKAKVAEAKHDHAALASGRKSSIGESANGSHKGLPASYEFVGHKSGVHVPQARLGMPENAAAPVHDAAALAAGRTNSMGVSADGSHKGIPTSKAHAGQR